MSYIKNTLLPDEKIIFSTSPNPVILYPGFIWILIVAAMFLFVPQYIFFAYLALLIAITSFISSYITYISTEYAITNRRVLAKFGLFRINTLEIFFNKIESVSVNQSIPGRILNYGAVIICGTGGSKDPFFYIPNPLIFRRQIQEQMEHIFQKDNTDK